VWRTRIVAIKAGWLVAVFEQGRRPTYHTAGADRQTVLALIDGPGRLVDGLPSDAVIAELVEAGYIVTCRLPGT
jgi:hypothetical protein